jgi:hypothetical protein
MATYNGHKNWNHWNVSLWINNDEGLYNRARELARRSNRERAVAQLLAELPAETPDGAPYTKTTVRAAMRDII